MSKLKTHIYIIVIFTNITIFSSLSISTFQSILKDSITNNGNISDNSIECHLSSKNNILPNDFLKNIYSMNNIYIEKVGLNPGAFLGKAIYFKGSDKDEIKIEPNMISGEYFNEKNIRSDEPLAVIGKDMLKSTKKIDGNLYFEYENVKYKVIGIMGYKNRKSLSDLKFVINLSSYLKNTKSILISGNYFIDSLNNKSSVVEKFINSLKPYDKNLTTEKVSNKNDLINNFISQGLNVSIVFCIVIFLIFINVFNVTLQWIETKKKNIGIKKALGGTNFKISLEILIEYQLVAMFSYIIGTLIYSIIIKLHLISIFNADLYLFSSFVTFIFSSFIALITSLFAIMKSLKIPPSIIMKGGI